MNLSDEQPLIITNCLITKPNDPKELFKKVEDYREKRSLFIQLFDPRFVISKDHLMWAYNKAKKEISRGSNRADNIEIETLLWASGERQIKDAISKIGISKENEKAVIMIDEDPSNFLEYMGWNRDDSVLEFSKEKLKNHGISDKEIESTDKPQDLIFEKMATSMI